MLWLLNTVWFSKCVSDQPFTGPFMCLCVCGLAIIKDKNVCRQNTWQMGGFPWGLCWQDLLPIKLLKRKQTMQEGLSQSDTLYLFHSQPVVIPAHSRLHSRGAGNKLTLAYSAIRARCLHYLHQTSQNKHWELSKTPLTKEHVGEINKNNAPIPKKMGCYVKCK